jgi:hypothetical protein
VPDLFDLVAQPMGSIDLLTAQAGTRAQAPPVMRADRNGRRGSQATWSPALPVPPPGPAGYGPCAESPLLICPGGWPAGLPHGGSTRSHGGSSRLQDHLGRLGRLRLGCRNSRAAAGGSHRAFPMIKHREAAAAVRPGPAAPFRLTVLVVSAGHMPGPVRRAGAGASFRLRIAGPAGPCRVSVEW